MNPTQITHRSFLSCLAFAAAVTASAVHGQVVTVFEEDFSLTKTAVAPNDGQLVYSLFNNIEGTGITTSSPNQQLTVSYNAPANGFSADNNFAIRHLDNETGPGNLRLRTYNTVYADDVTTIAFDYHPVSYGNQGMRFLVATASGALNQLNFALHTAAGAVQNGYEAQGDPLTQDGFIELGKWYHYEVTVDPSAQTYDVKIWVDGTADPILTVSDLTYVNPISGVIGRVEWQPFGNSECVGLEAYIDNIKITQGVDPSSTWAGFDITEDDWVDTGAWMGWLNVRHAPWLYSSSLASWLYLPESQVTGSGAWAFFTK